MMRGVGFRGHSEDIILSTNWVSAARSGNVGFVFGEGAGVGLLLLLMVGAWDPWGE